MIETKIILSESNKMLFVSRDPDFNPSVNDILELDDNALYEVTSIRHRWSKPGDKLCYKCRIVAVKLIPKG